ncbi:hypothetical protein GGF46_000410 [Coemansia sp. RSA 552]|nr:hypothetical protein GGF46_000410 [Coemansia sp. RSA 552]
MHLGAWLVLVLLAIQCAGQPLGRPQGCGVEGASSPTLCDPGVQQYSGYIDVAPDRHLFYWFFEARQPRRPKQQTPLILWLNGGPGCSSMSGLFGGVGPCTVDSSGNGTTINENSWNINANILFLDQPANTGYSYGGRVTNTRDAASDVVTFLRRFYLQYPQYSLSQLHVTGESYAAHYVPAVAAQILSENTNPWRRRLPLASIAVGNGLFDMALQYQYLPQMACNSTYVSIANATTCDAMNAARVEFVRQLGQTQPYRLPSAEAVANATLAGYDILSPYQLAGGNPYDLRTKCGNGSLCDPYMDRIVAYASQPHVRAELGVRKDHEYVLCNTDVQNAFIQSGDEMVDSSAWIPQILAAGVRVLVYAGDADLICGWVGNKALVLRMRWPGSTGFAASPDWLWPNQQAAQGEARSFGGLTFVRVFGAGHMVAKDQPAVARAMLSQWISYGQLLPPA